MKISLNSIKKYIDINIPTDELIKLIGSRLVEVEGTEDLSAKYNNIYIVKVVECSLIEGTHLHLCQVDTGDASTVQVVCGAPNVHKGMLAAWIAPGAIVPCTYGNENFKISVRKLRGFDSHGMLAAADELALGEDHEGIIDIDPKLAKPGDSFAEVFDLNDVILDIENKSLTHRPDCFGVIGFAREVAGILGLKFTEPDLGAAPLKFTNQDLTVKITDSKICPRYTAAVIEMPDAASDHKYFTQADAFLGKLGSHSISKIVDVTNILMYQTGQPLHAFDYDKFITVGNTKHPKIIVRTAKDGESLQLLDGKTITCSTNDILITSNDVPVALAGAMGGQNTAIDASTKRVIIESASFSLYNLRKTQMAHGIFSEAITRFTKGIPPAGTADVLAVAVDMLGGRLVTTADAYPHPAKPTPITLTTTDINSLLGTNYNVDLITKTLDNVGIKVSSQDTISEGLSQDAAVRPLGRGQTERGASVTTGRADALRESTCALTTTPPPWRTDLHIKQDIIEEVGRLLGYDNIPLAYPTRPFIGAIKNPFFTLKSTLRTLLSDQLGAHEVLTYSFVSAKLLDKVGEDPDNSYQIVNSISPELQYFRQSITPSLIDKIRENLKSGHTDFTLYELNQISQKSDKLTKEHTPVTKNHLGVVTLGDYYHIKSMLEHLARNLKQTLKIQKFTTSTAHYLEPLHSADLYLGDTFIGSMGEVRASVLNQFKLKGPVSVLELDLAPLLAAPATEFIPVTPSKYPAVERDITFRVAAGTNFATIHDLVVGSLRAQDLIFTVRPTSIYQSINRSTKNLSFHLRFASPTHTLEPAAISAIMGTIANTVTEATGGTVV